MKVIFVPSCVTSTKFTSVFIIVVPWQSPDIDVIKRTKPDSKLVKESRAWEEIESKQTRVAKRQHKNERFLQL